MVWIHNRGDGLDQRPLIPRSASDNIMSPTMMIGSEPRYADDPCGGLSYALCAIRLVWINI